MRTRLATLGCSLIAVAVTGCAATDLSVSKVNANPSAPGIRYSLPQPFLLVTPNSSGDGGFETKVVYLPDDSQTYAIDARTKRGKYTLDVSLVEGLLSKVAWKRDDAVVAAEAARASGEIAKAELERANTEKKAKDDKAELERKEARTKLQTLEEQLRQKQLDVQLAEAEVTAAQTAVNAASVSERGPLQAALRAAQLKLAQEQLRVAAAQTAVTTAQARVNELAHAMNDPSAAGVATPRDTPPRARFWGPVLYRIVDDARARTVRLLAVRWDDGRAQLPLETAAPPKPTPPPTSAPALTNTTPIALTFPQNAAEFALQLTFDKPLTAVDTLQSLLLRTGNSPGVEPNKFNLSLKADDPKVIIVRLLRIPAGTYDILLRFTHGENTTASVTVPLKVALE